MGEGSAVFLVDPLGRVLLQQRDDAVGPAGYGRWAVPGGGREGDESPAQTLVREFQEETGATLQRFQHFGDFLGMMRPDDSRGLLHAFCSNDVVPRDRITVMEGLDFQYWHPSQMDALPMNPKTRRLVHEFTASAAYSELTGTGPATGVQVLEIDRWGRVLVERSSLGDGDLSTELFSLPAGPIGAGEGPDAAGLRVFEEATGALLPTLKLYRSYARQHDLPNAAFDRAHAYYHDADLDADTLGTGEARFLYLDTLALASAPLLERERKVLLEFVESPAYKAMFH
jgi:8-oxo-dGTP pyrophosphatase MutT (NUDIX family)